MASDRSPSSLSRRRVLGTTAAAAGAAGLAAVGSALSPTRAAAAPYGSTSIPVATGLPAEKLVWQTYGDWVEQRLVPRGSESYVLGRYDAMGARESASVAGAVELWCRFDKANADQFHNMSSFRGLQLPPTEAIVDESWRSAAWCSLYNTPAAGTFEIDITMPKRAGISYAAMLWPEDNDVWPTGEIDFLEGITGAPTTTSNVHYNRWGGDSGSELMSDHRIDVSGQHRYRIEIAPGWLRLSQDGQVYRELNSPHVPYGVRSHLVLQIGAHKSVLGIGGSAGLDWERIAGYSYDTSSSAYRNFYFSEMALVAPITIP